MLDMEETAAEPTSQGKTAPYVSFQSLKTLMSTLKANGVPSRIDRSMMTNFSGSVGGQVLTALKFLALTDGRGHPTEILRVLVDAVETEAWPEELGKVLKTAFAPMFELNLQTASPAQFNERFRQTYSGTEDVLRKCRTFFLNAASDANIPVSSYIMKDKKPRTAVKRRRRMNLGPINGAAEKEETSSQGNEQPNRQRTHDVDPPPPTSQKTYEMLIGILDPIGMDEEEQKAIWTIIRYLRRRDVEKTAE